MTTRPLAINSSKLVIALGNGASPEAFAGVCMINTARGIEFTSNPTETLLPFCPPDEDLAGWIEREADSLSARIQGSGILDAKAVSIETFWDWYELGHNKNIHAVVGAAGYWAGSWICTTLNMNGPGRREKVTFEATIMSDGPIVWVATT